MGHKRGTRGLGAAALVAALAAAAVQPANATDLETLRRRAQAVADEVTSLEHRLAGLNQRRVSLEREIAAASRDIGIVETEIRDAETAYQAARKTYVEKAVEVYKAGDLTRLALLLSARDLSQLYAIDIGTRQSTEDAAEALGDLLEIQHAAERAQQRLDERKQKLLVAQAKVEGLATSIESTIATRRRTLRALNAEVERLEEEARRQAAALRAANPDDALLDVLGPSGRSSGIPKEFVGTGVTFEGIASWYGPGFEGNPTASGDIFDPDLYTAASKELPLGTWLYVEHSGRGVVVLVNDRGPYVDGRILDLSQAAAEAIGITGLGWIEAELLIKA